MTLLRQEHAAFRGIISSDIDSGDDPSQRMQRSGFSGFNTEVSLSFISSLPYRLQGGYRQARVLSISVASRLVYMKPEAVQAPCRLRAL